MQTTPHYIAIFLIATILVMSALLGVLMLFLLRNQKRHEVYQTSLDTLQSEWTHNLLMNQVEIQEQTFKNIACEIHDNINLTLTLSKLTLHQLSEPDPPSDVVDRTLQYISKAIRDLSAISRGLNEEIIQQQGLVNAINEELDRVRRSSRLRTELSIEGEPAFLPAQHELLLFRAIQESYNNILKHSRATNAWLTLTYSGEWVKVDICDDGIGFDPESLAGRQGRSTGLLTIQSRVQLFGGHFHFESAPMNGTKLSFEIPIKQDDNDKNLPDRLGGRPRLGKERPRATDQRL